MGAMPAVVRRLLAAGAAHALFAASMGLLLLLPVYLREHGASHALVGLLMGVAAGVGVGVRPLAGWALDRLGRRPVVILGGAASAAAACLYLFSDGANVYLCVGRVVTGFANGILFATFFTCAADVVPEKRRAQGIALFGLTGMVPMTVAPVFGEWIVRHWGFAGLFRAVVVCAAASLAASFAMRETSEGPVTQETSAVENFVTVFRHPPLFSVWILAGFFGTALGAAFTFAAPSAVERGAGPASMFFLAYGALSAVVRVFGGHLPDRFGAVRVAAPALLSYALGLAALAAAYSPALLILAGALAGIGHGLVFPSAGALAVARAPRRLRGTAMAMLTGVIDLCFLVSAPVLGRIGDWKGPEALFGFAALAVVLGLLWWVRRERGLALLESREA